MDTELVPAWMIEDILVSPTDSEQLYLSLEEPPVVPKPTVADVISFDI